MSTTNGLTDAEEERLECLAEEAGEIVQAAMKVLRHGYASYHPDDPQRITNRVKLGAEIGNLKFVLGRMETLCDLSIDDILAGVVSKAEHWPIYTHHQEESQ